MLKQTNWHLLLGTTSIWNLIRLYPTQWNWLYSAWNISFNFDFQSTNWLHYMHSTMRITLGATAKIRAISIKKKFHIFPLVYLWVESMNVPLYCLIYWYIFYILNRNMDWLPQIPLWVTCGACWYKLKYSFMEGHVFTIWIRFFLRFGQITMVRVEIQVLLDLLLFHINIRWRDSLGVPKTIASLA